MQAYKSTMVVHGSLEGGRGWGTHRGGPKAPIGATDPVLNIVHRDQVTAPTGAFAMATRRSRHHPVSLPAKWAPVNGSNRCLCHFGRLVPV